MSIFFQKIVAKKESNSQLQSQEKGRLFGKKEFLRPFEQKMTLLDIPPLLCFCVGKNP
jgi:hypothetical protein